MNSMCLYVDTFEHPSGLHRKHCELLVVGFILKASRKFVFFGKNQFMSNTVALEKRLLTCHDYHAMIAAGILDEEDKVELINGELIYRSPIGPNHGSVVGRILAEVFE